MGKLIKLSYQNHKAETWNPLAPQESSEMNPYEAGSQAVSPRIYLLVCFWPEASPPLLSVFSLQVSEVKDPVLSQVYRRTWARICILY